MTTTIDSINPAAELATQYRVAPRGFSDDELEVLFRDGLVTLHQERLSSDEIEAYLEAIEVCIADGPPYNPLKTYRLTHIVEKHPLLADLIDHERHVGYAYDFFGEHLRMSQSDLFIRPQGSYVNNWHIDGPRVVPHHVFSAPLPMKLRIGYWLTDLPEPGMGNLVYLPGSHRDLEPGTVGPYESLSSHANPVPGEKTLCCPAGTLTAFFGHIWHRVDKSESPVTRKTIFVSYTPSWISGYHPTDHEWIKTLNREQRIIMRPYEDDWENYSRPPAEDLPLFLDRETLTDADPGTNFEAERHKRRRLTRAEKFLARRPAPVVRHELTAT